MFLFLNSLNGMVKDSFPSETSGKERRAEFQNGFPESKSKVRSLNTIAGGLAN